MQSMHYFIELIRLGLIVNIFVSSNAQQLLGEHNDRSVCTAQGRLTDQIRKLQNQHDQLKEAFSEEIDQIKNQIKEKNIPEDDVDGSVFGSDGELKYSDREWWRGRVITGIRLICMESRYFTGIQVRYGEDWAPPHGTPDDPLCKSRSLKWLNFTLASGEKITRVNMKYGKTDHGPSKIIHTFAIFTNKRAFDTCEEDSQFLRNEKSTHSSGMRLEYISSRSGCSVYGIKLYWRN